MTDHLEAELKRAKAEAAEASQLKNKFVAKVSHDLRAPLNGIIGFAELMYHEKVGPISAEHKEYLGDILLSARLLLTLVNNVLDIAKVESGKMEFFPEPIDLKKILKETLQIFEPLISSKKIHMRVEVDPSLHKVIIDPVRFKQVIYNYVSNALKCTAEGGTVVVRTIPKGPKGIMLEVEDTGVGIREEDLSRLFVEFQQLNREIAKQYPSTGLGLALTKHIVEAQGGKVGVKSTFGKGSTFFAVFPVHSFDKELTEGNNP